MLTEKAVRDRTPQVAHARYPDGTVAILTVCLPDGTGYQVTSDERGNPQRMIFLHDRHVGPGVMLDNVTGNMVVLHPPDVQSLVR